MLMIDPPPARFAGNDGRGRLEHAARVHAEDQVPFLLADLHQRLELQRTEDAGIVDQDVDGTERRLGGGDELGQRFVVGHVAGDGDGFAALIVDLPDGVGAILHVRHGHLGPLYRESKRERGADALGRSSHDGHFAFKARHDHPR
jgi:hypothetical protein